MTQAMKRPSPSFHWKTLLASMPGLAIGLLPALACPACWAAYAGIVAMLGLGFLLDRAQLLALTGLLLGIAIISFAYRAKARHGYGPALLGTVAASFVLAGKFAIGFGPLWYAGLALFFAAALWNAWPRRATADTCTACAAQDRKPTNEAHNLEVQS